METSTKKQNEQQKAKPNNQRHLPVLVSEIELILKNKNEQQRAAKATNGKWKHAPKSKRATKSNKVHFSFPFSFICFISGPIKSGFHLNFFYLLVLALVFRTNKNPKRAMRYSNGNIYKKQDEQQKAKTSNQRHLSFWFLRLIISKKKTKQERATKNS